MFSLQLLLVMVTTRSEIQSSLGSTMLMESIIFIGLFCDGNLEVAFKKNTCFIRNKYKVDLLKGSRTINLYSISLKDMLEDSKRISSKRPCTRLTYVEVRKGTLMSFIPIRVESVNEKMYILVVVDDYTRFGWVRFLRTKDDTPEVIKKFIILTQRVFVGYASTKKAYRIYNKRTCKIQETVHVTFDELTEGMNFVELSTGLGLNSMAPEHINAGSDVNQLQSGLIGSRFVTTPTTPSVPPIEKQLSKLFQPLYDEDEDFLPKVQPQLVYVAPPRAPEIAHDSPSTTTIKKDAPTTTTITLPSPSSPPDTSVDKLEITITTPGSDSFRNSVTYEIYSEASSFGTVNVDTTQLKNPPLEHAQEWTKDHMLENVIRDINRLVSTR
nr:hypothetical protein [Tanacetum cinerariifolium]